MLKEILSSYFRYRPTVAEIGLWARQVCDLRDKLNLEKENIKLLQKSFKQHSEQHAIDRCRKVTALQAKIEENTDKYMEYLIKENKRYEKKKDIGQLKLIDDLPERQQRSRRRNWRKQKQA